MEHPPHDSSIVLVFVIVIRAAHSGGLTNGARPGGGHIWEQIKARPRASTPFGHPSEWHNILFASRTPSAVFGILTAEEKN